MCRKAVEAAQQTTPGLELMDEMTTVKLIEFTEKHKDKTVDEGSSDQAERDTKKSIKQLGKDEVQSVHKRILKKNITRQSRACRAKAEASCPLKYD